ncbi:MAG: hypothetical protein ACLP9L_32400 [Thermoguttaceae bacterium]
MTKIRLFPRLMVVLVTGSLSVPANSSAWAGATSQLAKEIAESVSQRFGRQAIREGTEVLATRIETAAARHGSDVFEAVRKVGPRALPLMEEAGTHGSQAARVLAQHGEEGATWVVSRPRAMSLVLRHGDAAAGVLVKHAGGIAEPVVEQYGARAIRALEATGPQSGRRLAMMMADGELAKIGRTEEVLEAVASHGDRCMDFIWRNKGPLAVGTTLTAFLANPEAFLHAAQGVTQTVAENVVRPVAEVPGTAVKGVVEGTNWTIVFGLGVLAVGSLAAFRLRLKQTSSVVRNQ